MTSSKHNPEKRAFRGRSYRKGGNNIRDLREKVKVNDMDELSCDCCGKIPSVDPVTDEYDLYQNLHAGPMGGLWWCGECIGAKDGKPPPCPDEFLDVNGKCWVCS